MGMKFKETEFVASKQILAIPDHYVAIPQYVKSADPAVVTEGTRKILKAGTIWPTNDTKAVGVVLNDYDVTDGDANIALVIHGFVKKAALPTEPAAEAVTALPMIKFIAKPAE